MRKKIAAVMLALGLAVTGATLGAAPASAQMGTTVYVFSTHGTGWAKVTNVNGWEKILHEGETGKNVNEICPPSSGWELDVYGPNGTRRIVAPGVCYYPNNSGIYQVGVFKAGTSA